MLLTALLPAPLSSAADLPRLYTIGETANQLGIREDDLLVLLPDTALVLENREMLQLTCADMETLERLLAYIQQFAAESVYGGGEL